MATAVRRGVSAMLRSSHLRRHALPTVQQARNLDDDGDATGAMSTTINFINQQEDINFVDAYSHLGFRLNSGIRIMGPMVVFARSILHWNVIRAADINEKSLSLFPLLAPKLDMLVLGVGDRSETSAFNPKMISYLREKRIAVEVLPTDQALATFNFLISEQRYVAGAFIPPSYEQSFSLESIDEISSEFLNVTTDEIMEDTLYDPVTDRRLTKEEATLKANLNISDVKDGLKKLWK